MLRVVARAAETYYPGNYPRVEAALRLAMQAANGKDVRLGGGAATLRQYLRARLVDEMHVAFGPILLGSGEALFAGLDLPALGYKRTQHAATENAMHLVLAKST